MENEAWEKLQNEEFYDFDVKTSFPTKSEM
jgi:hypothetical protein